MHGYGNSSYGDAFADVYDTWYAGITDADSTVATLAAVAAPTDPLPIVELGTGTGRLAIPLALAVRPRRIVGIDASAAMLAALAAKPERPTNLTAVLGDFVDDLPDGPLGCVFVAYNTFFGLLSPERQQRCFDAVAARLAPGGCFVIEAFVPERGPHAPSSVEVRSLSVDRVVLSVSVHDDRHQTAEGQFIEITERGGVRLRPWSIRYAPPAELDAMATAAGLERRDRWADFAGQPFGDDSTQHVTVYRKS